MRRMLPWTLAAACVAFLSLACTDDGPVGASAQAPLAASTFPAPANLVTVDDFSFFPYTADDFNADPKDPVNLIFTGNVDPRQIRAALLALPDGDRSGFGFPSTFPFDCTWRDALGGDEQVAWAGGDWTGSAIQLACGDYGPVRFHLRLFPAGSRTVANAHFEVQIGTTTDHQVLSWELAEQLLTADLVRTGIAAPVGLAGGINDAPYFRIIIEEVYDALPPDLQALAVTLSDDVHAIATDGNATILAVFGQAAVVPGVFEQTQVFQFDLVIPKPFCATEEVPYVYVNGPVTLQQTDVVTEGGEYSREFAAAGELSLAPIDLSTGQPDLSRSYKAIIRERHDAKFWEGMLSVSYEKLQSEVPPTGVERGRTRVSLQLGPNGKTRFESTESCTP